VSIFGPDGVGAGVGFPFPAGEAEGDGLGEGLGVGRPFTACGAAPVALGPGVPRSISSPNPVDAGNFKVVSSLVSVITPAVVCSRETFAATADGETAYPGGAGNPEPVPRLPEHAAMPSAAAPAITYAIFRSTRFPTTALFSAPSEAGLRSERL
jgi:hypothetical protein